MNGIVMNPMRITETKEVYAPSNNKLYQDVSVSNETVLVLVKEDPVAYLIFLGIGWLLLLLRWHFCVVF